MYQNNNLTSFCDEYHIVLVTTDALTKRIHGFCFYDGENYNVFINKNLGIDRQRKTVVQELLFVLQNHFSCLESDKAKCSNQVDEMVGELKAHAYEYSIDLV